MSNYIIDYLVPQGSTALVKEAGFLSKLTKLFHKTETPVTLMKKTFPELKSPRTKLKEQISRLEDILGGKNPKRTRRAFATQEEYDDFLSQVRRNWFKAQDELAARPRLQEIEVPRSLSASSIEPFLKYDRNAGKGFSAAFSSRPNTTSMSENLAKAISDDASFASNIGGSLSFSAPTKSTAKVLSELGLL